GRRLADGGAGGGGGGRGRWRRRRGRDGGRGGCGRRGRPGGHRRRDGHGRGDAGAGRQLGGVVAVAGDHEHHRDKDHGGEAKPDRPFTSHFRTALPGAAASAYGAVVGGHLRTAPGEEDPYIGVGLD